MAQKLKALDEPDLGMPVVPKKVRPCSLDQPTQALIKLIFSTDMFNHALKTMEIGECGFFFDTSLIVAHLVKFPWCRHQEDASREAQQSADC